MQGLLALHGIYGYRPLKADRRVRLAGLRCADGEALPARLRLEIERELERLELVSAQIAALEQARQTAHKAAPAAGVVRLLLRVKAIGLETASVLGHEVLYRRFANRRRVASFVGLCGSPFQSGGMAHEQGIAKAGNKRARAVLIELAWSWLRLQPDSAITQWFKTRAAGANARRRKQLIPTFAGTAVARRILVDLWRYVTTGLLPPDLRLKPV